MKKTRTSKLSLKKASEIAILLFEALQVIYPHISDQIPRFRSTSNPNILTNVTTITCSPDNSGEANITSKQLSHVEREKGGYPNGQVNELFWNNRHFRVCFYAHPEECGYYTLLTEWYDMPYMLCAVSEKKPDGQIKYEMYFALDYDTMTFLELFDIDYYVNKNHLWSLPERNIPQLEETFRNLYLL